MKTLSRLRLFLLRVEVGRWAMGMRGTVRLLQKSANIMGHEESIRLRFAIGRGAGIVQGLPISPDIISYAVWLYYRFPLSVERCHAAVLSPEMAASSPRIGGAILCAAGVYQLTPSPLTPARPRATASCVHSRSSVAWTDACRQGERSTRDTGSEKTYRSSRRLRGPLSAIQCHLLEQMHLAKLQGRPIKTGSVCVRF